MANHLVVVNASTTGEITKQIYYDVGGGAWAQGVYFAGGSISTTNSANGAPGSAAPVQATQIGGTDGVNLRAFSTDAAGRLNARVMGLDGSAIASAANAFPTQIYSVSGVAATFTTASTDTASATTTGSLLGVSSWGRLFNGTNGSRIYQIDAVSGGAATGVQAMGSPALATVAAARTSNQNATAASSIVLKNTAGNFYGFNAATAATAGYVMLFDATALPSNGTVTPKRVWAIAANASIELECDRPIRCATGIVLAFSSTGPYALTANATAFLAGDYV